MANRNASHRSYDYNRDYNRDYDYYDPYYYNRGYYGNPGYGFNYRYGSYPYYHDEYYTYSYPYGGSNYGHYAGYGPSGYTRPDDRIKDDINDRLTWNGQLDASDINVDVNDGVVTLTGMVDSRRDKRLPEDIADSVSGVWDVNNQLGVRNKKGSRGERGMSASQIRTGMDVVAQDGARIGTVKDVRTNDFLVDRRGESDVFIPLSACYVDNGQVNLNIPASEVDQQGWDKMPEKVQARNKGR